MRWVLSIILVVLVIVVGGLVWRASRQAHNALLKKLTGERAVAESRYVPISGLDQWVSIRGEDNENPVLVVLHGGPGAGFDLIAHQTTRAWERDFTVVNWDQPGAGRTFGRSGKGGAGDMSIERMSTDAITVIEYAIARTGRPKVILVGASWGSILGVSVAHRRPDLLYAFVGTGQVVDFSENEAVTYSQLMAKLRVSGAERDAARLSQIGPPPYAGLGDLYRERFIAFAHAPESERGFMAKVMLAAVTAPDARLSDVWTWAAAQPYSIRRLIKAISAYSDLSPAPAFDVPVVIIQGEEDIQTPTSLARRYFDMLDAPSKTFVTISGGGHNVVIAMPEAFRAALLEHVRPLAIPHP